jgi:hypothetical protein
MPNEFKIKNGFFSEGSSNITGSLTVTGNVGIGTSNPTRTLQVVGEAAIPTLGVGSGGFFLASSNGLYGLFGGVSGATGDTWLQAMRNNTATAYNILLNPVGGNVGIGTSTPTARLHVQAQGALSTDIGFRVRNSANTLDIIRAQGDGSVFVGLGAGNINTGANNSFFGIDAGRLNTTGFNNTAYGLSAFRNNTTGNNNSAFGIESLRYNTTGNNNSAFGLHSLINSTNGSNNVAVGIFSGRFIADGTTANSITNNSVFIGASTKALADNQTNQIVIGHDAIGLGSNSVVLGNNSITLTVLKGNVGIGTTSPGSKLDVVGNIGVSGNILDTNGAGFKWDTLGYLYAGNYVDPQGNLAYQVDAGIASITNQKSFDPSWITNPSYNGQILADAIAGETISAGQLVYLRTDGSWYLAAATAVITATQLIGIALKNAEATEKFAILLDGLIGISYHDQFGTISIGAPLYVSTTAGNVSEAAPTNSGEIIRLVGHNIYENSSNYAVIRFQPDNSWIEL